MNTCKKNILVIFGSLLILAILFIPYNSTRVTIKNKYDPMSGIKLRITSTRSGYMFFPQIFKTKYSKIPYKEVSKETYRLNTRLFLIEIAIIIFLAGFDYLLFCAVLKKEKNSMGSGI